MKTIRYTAAFVTAVMALLNLPAGFTDSKDVPKALAWIGTALGVAGVVTLVGLARRHPRSMSSIAIVGLLNLAVGVATVASGSGIGVVGIILGGSAAALGSISMRRTTATAAVG